MVSERDLTQAIEQIESKDAHTIEDCSKLAALYTVLDKRREEDGQTWDQSKAYSQAAKPVIAEIVGAYGDSDFLKSIEGFNAQDAWLLVDELMESLKVLNPRLYGSVMRRIA